MTQPQIFQQTPDGELPAGAGEADAMQRPRGLALLAWIVIVGLVVLIHSTPAQPQPGEGGGFNIGLKMLEFQGKYFVGAVRLTGDSQALAPYLAGLNQGGVEQRTCYVVLTGELAGPAEAAGELQQLEKLLAENGKQPTDEQRDVLDSLAALYGDYDNGRWQAPSLNQRQRRQLRDELGWFGDLALAPEVPRQAADAARQDVLRTAQLTVTAAVSFFLAALFAGGVGLIALPVFMFLAATGRIRFRAAANGSRSGILAETFAFWMAGFLGLNVAAGLVAQRFGHLLAWLLAAFFLSLGALIWPVFRGIPWRELRRGIGLEFGRGWTEPLWGLLGYLATLPLLFVALIVMLLLAALLASAAGPAEPLSDPQMSAHPAVGWMLQADGWVRLQIILLAVLAAPLVEETMFRGVLYGHLRAATARWRVAASVLFSGLTSGLLFAAVHPQGIIAVPPLMALAFGFAMLREWRGTLLAPMTAHATHNGIMMGLLLLLF